MLLYADDAVLFSKSPVHLQEMLNKLHEYSQTWGLQVNTSKTKIMIFEKGRPTSTEFYYNNTLLENVDNFKYLGVKFYKNGCWNRTQKCLSEYGSFALHNLYRLFQDVTLCTKEKFKLFDTLVGSVLSYACEVWGFHGAPDIERIHSQFCRYLLGVKKSTNIAALHTELGRLPMIISRKLRILRYWFKIINTENVVVREIYNMLLQDATNGNTYNGSNWAYQVKSMLENLGFNYIWYNQAFEENFYSMIKQRLLDTAKQDLLMQINSSAKLQTYCLFKHDTDLAKYLDLITNCKYKLALSRFRLSSHNLAIETGRYSGIAREDRLCTLCNMRMAETEFHFLLVCTHYVDLRRKYFPAYFCRWPSLNKFNTLLQSQSKHVLLNLSKFIYFAEKRRSLILQLT